MTNPKLKRYCATLAGSLPTSVNDLLVVPQADGTVHVMDRNFVAAYVDPRTRQVSRGTDDTGVRTPPHIFDPVANAVRSMPPLNGDGRAEYAPKTGRYAAR